MEEKESGTWKLVGGCAGTLLRSFCRASLRPLRWDTGNLTPFTDRCDMHKELAFLGGTHSGAFLSSGFHKTELTTAVEGWRGSFLRHLGCHLHLMGFSLQGLLRTRNEHRATGRPCRGQDSVTA